MVKYIYKSVILVVVFVASLLFFGHRLETDIHDEGISLELGSETFPQITIRTQGHTFNTLYGYSAPMESDIVRESVTPLAQDQKLTLLFSEAASRLIQLQYQILDKESGEIYFSEKLNAIPAGQKQVEIMPDYNFKTSTEYILDIQGTSDEGREIHYYTRLKYYLDNSRLDEKLEFVSKIHNDTFDKNKIQELEKYLESDGSNPNATLAKVDITSDVESVTWCGLSPKVISDEIITIKEYNMETACVQYNYFIKAKSETGQEIYHVKEFYRVRHASGNNYLLNFERTMEAQFDPKQASVRSGQLKLGITNDSESRLLADKEEKVLYFARGGDLYRYDMVEETVTRVYASFSEQASYDVRAYDEQGIRLLKMDEEGNLYFCVYGYFSRGPYEGDVAVVLYEYTAEGTLHEMVCMPIRTTYQQLREDFAEYGYVSSQGIYYFTVANTVYAYNMTGKRLEKIQENVKDGSFKTMEGAHCYVWSSNLKTGCGSSITIYNLETDEKKVINSPAEDTDIRLLGVIEDNVVYGYVKKDDVTKSQDGSRVIPCYELYISDTQGNVLKKYKKQNRYIQNVSANGNVINMTLCRKQNGNFCQAGEDSILNQTKTVVSRFSYTSRLTNRSLTEWYIKFPSSFVMTKKPEQIEGASTFTTSERVVRLEQPEITRYYVYALGKITASYESVGKAIREADRQMGVVVSSNHQVVWERSGSFIQNSIGGITLTTSGGRVSNLAACAHMVLKQNHISVQAEKLSEKNKPLLDMLSDYMQRPVNLKGCSLEQVLYFVSGNKSVIAMTGDHSAVVIGGYTNSRLYLYDPESSHRRTVSRKEYEKIFEAAGNRFISYMAE